MITRDHPRVVDDPSEDRDDYTAVRDDDPGFIEDLPIVL